MSEFAASVCATILANADNDQLSDADFREFVRNTLSIDLSDPPASPKTVAATLEGEFEVVRLPSGRYNVLAGGVVRHPDANAESAIGALMHYLTDMTYRLRKVRAAIS